MYLSKTRVVDVGLYVLISLAVVAGIFGAAALKVPEDLFQRWVGLAGFTLVVFAQLIENSRALWRKDSFWVFVIVVMLVHLTTIIVLSGINLKTTTFQLMLSFFAEAIALRTLKNAIFRRRL